MQRESVSPAEICGWSPNFKQKKKLSWPSPPESEQIDLLNESAKQVNAGADDDMNFNLKTTPQELSVEGPSRFEGEEAVYCQQYNFPNRGRVSQRQIKLNVSQQKQQPECPINVKKIELGAHD